MTNLKKTVILYGMEQTKNENLIITDINRIIFVGKNEYKEKTIVFPYKTLFYHELIYHISGNSTVYFNEETLQVSPNVIRYLPAGDCTKYIVDGKTPSECIDVFFSSNIPLDERAFTLSVKNEKIQNLFKKIFLLWTQKENEYYLECVSLLYKIIAEMRKTNYLPDSQFQKIKPAIEYIQNNFLSNEIITAEQLVAVCGISYSYIKKLFQLKFKISPKRYILSLKMNHACDLLKHNEYGVSTVAQMCGYNDIYAFSHQFKSEFGVSPSEFIKKYKSSK